MAKNNRKTLKVTYKGFTYVGTRKGNTVSVRTERTARGQSLIAGVLDLTHKAWHNDNGETPLPAYVRDAFERSFA